MVAGMAALLWILWSLVMQSLKHLNLDTRDKTQGEVGWRSELNLLRERKNYEEE